MAYAERKNGKLTGRWCCDAEYKHPDGSTTRWHKAFPSKSEAEGAEAYYRASGRPMPRHHSYNSVTPQQVISRLEQEPYDARSDILSLMPREVEEKLWSYRSCENEQDYAEWKRSIIDFVVALAKPIPEASYFEERAHCSLCGSGGHTPYTEGYKIPGGLELHLTEPGRARYCPVINAVQKLALTHLKPKFEDEQRNAKEALATRPGSE
jgi:hypothetical protein